MDPKSGPLGPSGPENGRIRPLSHDRPHTCTENTRTTSTEPTGTMSERRQSNDGSATGSTVKAGVSKANGVPIYRTTNIPAAGVSIPAKITPARATVVQESVVKSSTSAETSRTQSICHTKVSALQTASSALGTVHMLEKGAGNDRVDVNYSHRPPIPAPNAFSQTRVSDPVPVTGGRASPKTVSFSNKIAVAIEQTKSTRTFVPLGGKALSQPAPAPAVLKPNTMPVLAASAAVRPVTSVPAGTSLIPTTLAPQLHHQLSSPEAVTSSELPPVDDSIQTLRATLVDTYAPYIQPTDTSLKAAKERLRTALEQTRHLRECFSDRVYQKYRVILKPVPKSLESMINKIKADPVAASQKLKGEIRALKLEKDIEKKEAQKINTALVASNTPNSGDNSIPASQQETADQLAFIGAGLSLVILPEEDVDPDEMNMSEYQHRGPINPETGSRVGGISAAAAAAAEVLLDRTRRSGAMRKEQQRRRQLQLLSGEDAEAELNTTAVYSHLHLLSSNSAPIVGVPIPAREVPSAVAVSAVAKVNATRVISSSSRAPAAFTSPPPPTKSSRARTHAAMSGSNLLSLNPSSDEILVSQGRPSASTAALIAKGVGAATSSRSVQQRWKHPHPESLGGRRLALSAAGSNKKTTSMITGMTGVASSSAGVSTYISTSLPPLPTAKERRSRKEVAVLDAEEAGNDRARMAVRSVLEHFCCKEIEKADSETETENWNNQNTKSESIKTDEVQGKTENDKVGKEGNEREMKDKGNSLAMFGRKKRRVTEIGLLRGMQQAKEEAEAKVGAIASSLPEGSVANTAERKEGSDSIPAQVAPESTGEDRMEPNIAFSVLYALGIVREAPKLSQPPQEEFFLSRILRDADNRNISDDTEVVAPSESIQANSADVKDFVKIMTSRKRLFSETFLRFQPESNHDEPREEHIGSNEGEKVCAMDVENEKTTPTASEPLTCSKESLDAKAPDGMAEQGTAEGSLSNQDCLVASIRGGGEALVGSSDEETQIEVSGKKLKNPGEGLSVMERDKDASSRPSRTPPVEMSAATHSLQGNYQQHSNRMPAYSPARGTMPNGVGAASARMQGQQQHSISPFPHRSQAHRMQMSPEYFGPTTNFVAAQQEWAAASAAAAGLLPGHTSLAALELSSRRAALVNLSVRERAARELIAREQAHAAAVHRHAAAAVRNRAAVAGLSPQQAAVLMGAQPNHGYQQQAAARFAHMGARPATAMMPPSAGNPTLVTSGGSAAIPNTVHSGIPQRSQQDSRSGPVSHNAPLSPPRGNRSLSSGKGRKETKQDLAQGLPPTVTARPKAASSPSRKRARAASFDGVKSAGGKLASTLDAPKREASKNGDRNNEKHMANIARTPQPPNKNKAVSQPDKKPESSTLNTANTDGPTAISLPQKIPAVNATVEMGPKKATLLSLPTVAPAVPIAVIPEDVSDETVTGTSGMRFCVPTPIAPLDAEAAKYVVDARVHVAAANLINHQNKKRDGAASPMGVSLIQYLLAVGTAVPIPKALVSYPLKERLNMPGFKSNNGGALTIPREVVVATIMVWLWGQHKQSFQRAFAKSGRIDVDPECKWLIQAAVDTSMRALMLEIADAVARGGPLAIALNRHKTGGASSNSAPLGGTSEGDRVPASSTNLDLLIASIVGEALMTELGVDEEMDMTLPYFEELVKLLDASRMSALRAKCQERALVATLVSRRATMSEPFAHAYVSSMVRAGEALGHEKLFDAVQHEDTKTSTMIPYDIFSDDTGAWEDPCRIPLGYTPHLTGDDLTRRAHARAMIQKSLKKLQDRHNIRGGTPNAGPYTDPSASSEGGTSGGSPKGSPNSVDGSNRFGGAGSFSRSSSGSRRKSSFAMGSDPLVPTGSGAAAATSLTLYTPNHYSAPLIWDNEDMENLPYGRYTSETRKRSLSISRFSTSKIPDSSKKPRSARSNSFSVSSLSKTDEKAVKTNGFMRSTEEISWTDVADIFQPVSLPGPTTPTSKKRDSHHHAPPVPAGTTIIAPFCRKTQGIPDETSEDDDSEEEEDLTDETIISRHRIVLERMKKRLDKFMEARQKAAQRARSRSGGR